MFNFDLSQDIEAYLLSNNDSNEYDIICHLQLIGRLPEGVLRQPLSLFRCHFLIFNALYRLQLMSLIHNRYTLEISSLRIQLSLNFNKNQNNQTPNPYDENHKSLSIFYLDYTQVMQTTEQDINVLLDNFWSSYFNNDQKHQALATLKLTEPVSAEQVTKQFRKLVMKHHPDRGGDAETLIEIHQARECLKNVLLTVPPRIITKKKIQFPSLCIL